MCLVKHLLDATFLSFHKMCFIYSKMSVNLDFFKIRDQDLDTKLKFQRLTKMEHSAIPTLTIKEVQVVLVLPVLKIYALMMLPGTFGKSSCQMACH